MLTKRIIFTLIYDSGFFTQSRNFRLQKVGNLKWLENNYNFKDIAFSLDELIVVNASRANRGMLDFTSMIGELVNDVYIPICAGGGIGCMEDAEMLFNNGADKIIVNSSLAKDPELIKKLIQRYGSQSVVASIDYKNIDGVNEVFINNGSTRISSSLKEYLSYVETFQIGEIYLNSIDKDGTGFGYDFETIREVSESITVPLIIAGGAGNEKHLIEGLKIPEVSAVATANLFNFIGDGIPNARNKVIEAGLNVTDWSKQIIT